MQTDGCGCVLQLVPGQSCALLLVFRGSFSHVFVFCPHQAKIPAVVCEFVVCSCEDLAGAGGAGEGRRGRAP